MTTDILQNEKKKTLVPQLRFQEFGEDWQKNTEKIKIVAGNAYDLNDYKENGIILIQGLNITPGRLDISTTYFLEESHSAKHIILEYDDILLGLNRPVTNGELKVCRYQLKKSGYLYQRAGRLEFKKEVIVSDFFYQYLRSQKFLRKISHELVGSDQPYIRTNLFEITTFLLPSSGEQQKIASFLTSVDESIQQLSRKRELLEQYKKGIMQQLFSGKLRFKDENGKDYPDWEEKKLGEVAEKRIVKNKHNSISLVFTNSAVQGIINQRDFFDKDIANKDNLTGYYVIENNDFIYNPRISNNAPVGPVSRNHLQTGIMSPLYSVFRFKIGNLDFIEKFFGSSVWFKHMKDISNYGARDDRMSFLTGDFYKMPIPFPSLPEQEKIATFLSSIDNKIENTNQQIIQMQNFKKGLLQQMFV